MIMNKIEIRRGEILKALATTPIATVSGLSGKLSVSLETIRKDLAALEDEGLVAKVHGGVALADNQKKATPYDIRQNLNPEIKSRIADAACTLIKPGDSIILESGTTTVALVDSLLSNPELLSTLVLITNSFRIAAMFESNQVLCRRLFFLGGWLNFTEHSTTGQYCAKSLRDFHVDTAFISGAAFSDEWILSGYYDDDVAFQKQAIESAKNSVLLLDSSKLHKSAVLSVCHVSELKYIVTNVDFPQSDIEKLSAFGVNTIFAKDF